VGVTPVIGHEGVTLIGKIAPRRQKDSRCRHAQIGPPRPQQGDERQVAACRLTGNGDRPALDRQRLKDRISVVDGCGPGMLRRKPVLGRDEPRIRAVGKCCSNDQVFPGAAGDISTAVEINDSPTRNQVSRNYLEAGNTGDLNG